MPEVQKPVLEHAAPKADQNQGLDGGLADKSLPDGNDDVELVNGERLITWQMYYNDPKIRESMDRMDVIKRQPQLFGR